MEEGMEWNEWNEWNGPPRRPPRTARRSPRDQVPSVIWTASAGANASPPGWRRPRGAWKIGGRLHFGLPPVGSGCAWRLQECEVVHRRVLRVGAETLFPPSTCPTNGTRPIRQPTVPG